MAVNSMSTSGRPFSDVLQDIIRNIQNIVRAEARLAKTELREEITKARSAAVLLCGGAVCGTFAALFVLLAIVYALTRVMPDWAAALIVAFILAVIAGVAVSAGLKRFKQVHPTPEKAIESLKENVEWAKQQTK